MYTFTNTVLPDGVTRRDINPQRRTHIEFKDDRGSMNIDDDYTVPNCTNRSLKQRWTGTTEFTINIKPLAQAERLSVDRSFG